MATRCRIAIEKEDGEVTSIYCHNDGYPDYVGKILLEDYTDRKKVEDLIDLGDISILGKHVLPLGEGHSYENPQDDVTVAYHRDRDEEFYHTRHLSKKGFFNGDIEEFGYLFTKENEWKFKECYRGSIFPLSAIK